VPYFVEVEEQSQGSIN
jgi:hypothetical protein